MVEHKRYKAATGQSEPVLGWDFQVEGGVPILRVAGKEGVLREVFTIGPTTIVRSSEAEDILKAAGMRLRFDGALACACEH